MPITHAVSTEPKIPMLQSQDSRVTIGRYSYGTPTLKVWGEADRIEIGSFCSIAEAVVILGGGEHRTDWISTYPFSQVFDLGEKAIVGHPATKGPTIIEHDVWLGFGCTVLSGVRIGSGAVVGAGAVVSKDVPPYTIVGGNPATVLRQRFSTQTVEALLEVRWWNWPIEVILENAALLGNPDTAAALAGLQKIAKGHT